jgi:hypothetical protein
MKKQGLSDAEVARRIDAQFAMEHPAGAGGMH